MDLEEIHKLNKKVFSEALILISQKKFDEAIAILDLQIEIVNQNIGLQIGQYVDYTNEFELYIFKPDDMESFYKKPVQIGLCQLYAMLASLLKTKKMWEEAYCAAVLAIKLNPLMCSASLTIAEVNLETKCEEKFLTTMSLLKYSLYKTADIIEYYHMWGKYFERKNMIPEAILSFQNSLFYEEKPEETLDLIKNLFLSNLKKSKRNLFLHPDFKKYDFAKAPTDFKIIRLACLGAQDALAVNDKKKALFLYQIANNIIQDDIIGEWIIETMHELKEQN